MWPRLKTWFARLAFRRSDNATDDGENASASSGALGERLAADHLRRALGYTIVARNWRNPRDRRDEIDLVCRDGDVLVFVEVKTRSSDALVQGYHTVDPRKKKVLRRACAAYLRALHPAPRTFRFDIVEVATPPADAPAGAEPELRHFENVELFRKHFRP